MQPKVVRFELCPADAPTGYAVGFHVGLKNGQGFYLDTVIPIADVRGQSPEEIVHRAGLDLLPEMRRRSDELLARPAVLGMVWLPPAPEPTPAQEPVAPVVVTDRPGFPLYTGQASVESPKPAAKPRKRKG